MSLLLSKTFVIDSKAFSLNKYLTGNGRFKSQDAVQWEASVIHKLSNPEFLEQFKEFADKFDRTQHRFEVELICYYPRTIFYTKKGEVSGRTFDCSNVEKPIIDILFGESYYNKSHPYGLKNINSDDRAICDLISRKRPADEHRVEVTIKLHTLNSLEH